MAASDVPGDGYREGGGGGGMTNKDRGGSPLAQVKALLREWDPIGVRPGVDAPANEYDSYAPAIVALVESGASAEDLAEHLGRVSTARMGLGARPARDLAVASAIVAAVKPTTSPWPPSMHDASLLEVRLDWSTGEAVLRFRVGPRMERLLVVREVTELVVPRREEWGRSMSVLTTSFLDDDPKHGLAVEMQSGDVLIVRGKVERDHAE